jgi:predicted transcriptional regulator
MKYRSRTDIISQILELANGTSAEDKDYGITKTKIMYGAFLSYAQMQEYLTILIDDGLLCYDLEIQTYKTTEKGHSFLEIYNKVDKVMKEEV